MAEATRDAVERKIKKAVSERSTLNRNLIVRISDQLRRQIEEMAQRMTNEMPGKRVTVSDVARVLLEHGVRSRYDNGTAANGIAAKRLRERQQRDDAEVQKLTEVLRERGVIGPEKEEGI